MFKNWFLIDTVLCCCTDMLIFVFQSHFLRCRASIHVSCTHRSGAMFSCQLHGGAVFQWGAWFYNQMLEYTQLQHRPLRFFWYIRYLHHSQLKSIHRKLLSHWFTFVLSWMSFLINLHVFSIADQNVLNCTLEGHTNAVWGLSVHSSKMQLLSCSADGTVRLWSPGEKPPLLQSYTAEEGKHSRAVRSQSCWAVRSESCSVHALLSLETLIKYDIYYKIGKFLWNCLIIETVIL